MKSNDYNLNDEPNLPLDDNGKNSFGLPNDYFSKFEDNFKKKIELESELYEFAALSSLEKIKAFTVPANYFKSFENSVECKVELPSYFKLQSIKKTLFPELEEDYKQQIELSINYKIEIVEELNPYETLYALNKENSFVVSEHYFDGVVENVKSRIFNVNENKKSIIDILLDVVFGKAMAFSLGLFLIIGLSVFFYQTPEINLESGDCKTLACLERQEILNNNKVITNFDDDQLMDLVDVNALNQQLKSTKGKAGIDSKQNFDSITEADVLDEL